MSPKNDITVLNVFCAMHTQQLCSIQTHVYQYYSSLVTKSDTVLFLVLVTNFESQFPDYYNIYNYKKINNKITIIITTKNTFVMWIDIYYIHALTHVTCMQKCIKKLGNSSELK